MTLYLVIPLVIQNNFHPETALKYHSHCMNSELQVIINSTNIKPLSSNIYYLTNTDNQFPNKQYKK